MNVGFDPGAHELRVLWQRGHKLVARQSRTAYAVLPDEPILRQTLVQSRASFARCDGHLILLGDAVATVGASLHCPTWHLMPAGQILKQDQLGQEILVAELEALLPPSQSPESLCGISFPRESVTAETGNFESTQNLLTQWVQGRGYTPVSISPGRAVVLAEMSTSGLTGLAVTFGAAYCTYSLCLQGTELVTGCVARGGQWLDQQLAAQLGKYCWDGHGERLPDWEGIAAWKIGESPSLIKPANPQQVLLRDLYRELLTDVYQQLFDDLFAAQLPRPFPPAPLVVSGGLARISGFNEFLSELWLRPGLPLEIDEIWTADDSPYTIARGCLIHLGLVRLSEKSAA